MAPHGTQKARGRPRKEHQKKAAGRASHQATVVIEDSDDEQLSAGHLVRRKQPHLPEVLGLLKKVAATIGEIDDFGDFFVGSGVQDAALLHDLRNHCETIISRLPSTAKTIQARIPSTIGKYNDRFVLRAPGKLVYVLRVEEVFQGKRLYTPRKVLSWVEDADAVGVDIPLYSLPGYKESTETHPRLLDPVVWQQEVRAFTRFHNYFFKVSHFDGHKGEVLNASHNEPRLMMAYACKLVEKHLGSQKPKQRDAGEIWQLGYIYKLRNLGKKFHGVISQTRPPCKPCLAFKKWFEEYSGIQFTFKDCRSLGFRPEKTIKDSKGYEIVPDYVSGHESEDSGEETDDTDSEWQLVEDHSIISSSSVPVVELRGALTKTFPKPASTSPSGSHRPQTQPNSPSPQKNSKYEKITAVPRKLTQVHEHRHAFQHREPSVVEETVTTVATTKQVQRRQLKEYMYNDPRTNSRNTFFETDDESDYEESHVKTSRSRKKTVQPYTPPSSARNLSAGFSGNPFPREALLEAERIKDKKRQRELDTQASPSASRKNKKSKRV